MHTMRALALAIAFGLTVSMARAEPASEKVCIIAAASKLPKIPDLTIVASRMMSVPVDEKQKQRGITLSGTVELDVRAAAQDVTFGFHCTVNESTGPIATPVGVLR